jgi:hypothetical protein
VKQFENIFILFCNGKSVTDPRYKGKMKTYMSRESFLSNRGEKPNEVLVEYTPVVEAYWVDVTRPGQITCGGNPVYACGRCGNIYGSHRMIPDANYCEKCGAKMKGLVE